MERHDIEARVHAALEDEAVLCANLALPQFCRQMETFALALVSDLVSEACVMSGGQDAAPLGRATFALNGQRYSVSTGESPERADLLSVSIRAMGLRSRRPLRDRRLTRLGTPGCQFTHMAFAFDARLEAHETVVRETAVTVVESAGRWIEQRVIRTLSELTDGVARDLYALLRQLVPAQLHQPVWLAVVSDRDGFYVCDAIKIREGLDSAAARAASGAGSPIEQIATLGSTILDADDIFAIRAHATGRPLGIDLTNAQYDDSYELAEEGVHHTEHLIVQPLVSDGTTKLAAVYPVALRADIEHVLEGARPRFRQAVLSRVALVRRFTRTMEQYGMSPGVAAKVGEFAGGFLKAIVSP